MRVDKTVSGHIETSAEQSRTEDPPISKVVVGVDGTAANWSAVSWAVAEARRVGRPLVLAASGPSSAPALAGSTEQEEQTTSERLTRDLLEDVRKRVKSQVPDVTTRVTTGEPAEALLRVADKVDLLVVGKRRGHPWSSAVLGSTAIAVAGRCSGPVVVVPEAWSVAERRSRQIVAGIDLQGDSEVLDLGFGRAQTLRVGLVVVHAWESPGSNDASRMQTQGSTIEDQQKLADFLAPWQEAYPNVDVSLESHPVAPAVSLLGSATDAQLLVVGRHGGPPPSGGPGLGSTVRKILHHASCPVVVVPEGHHD